MDRVTLAAMIDHTLLKPEATADEIVLLCEEATDLGVAAVCVSPSQLPITDGLGVGIDVCTVIGFPSGAHQPAVKAHEAEVAVDAGATEVDMVVNLGRGLGLTVIAEGIETEEQRQYLIGLGCHEGQGWLFARPMPADQLETYMQQR